MSGEALHSAIDDRSVEQLVETGPTAGAEDELCRVLGTGECDERVGRVVADDLVVAATQIGEQLAMHRHPIVTAGGAEAIRAPHVHAQQFGARSFRHARSATDEVLGRRCAGDRDDEAFTGFPGTLDAVLVAVLQQFVVDSVGDPQQGEFSQRAQVSCSEVVAERGVDSVTGVDVAVRDSAAQRLGGHVDEFDLVGAADDVVRDRLSLLDSGDARERVVEGLEVLHVDGGDDVDPCIEERLDVLPSLRMRRSRRVRVRHLVNQCDIGSSGENGLEVQVVELRAAVGDLAPRNDLESVEELPGAFASVGFHHGHDDIGSALEASSSFLQHLVGLADPGRGAEVHAQAPAGRRR